jgi:hypothetical protein
MTPTNLQRPQVQTRQRAHHQMHLAFCFLLHLGQTLILEDSKGLVYCKEELLARRLCRQSRFTETQASDRDLDLSRSVQTADEHLQLT